MPIILIPQFPHGQQDDDFEDLDLYDSHSVPQNRAPSAQTGNGRSNTPATPAKKKDAVYSRTEDKEFWDLFDRSAFSDAALNALEDRAGRTRARRQVLAESLPRESAPAHYRAEMKKLAALPNGEKKAEAFWQLSQEVADYRRGLEDISNPKTKVDNTAIERFFPALSVLGALGSLALSSTIPFMFIGVPLFLAGGTIVGALWAARRSTKGEEKWEAQLEQFRNDPLTREMKAVAHEINGQKLEAEKKAQEAATSPKSKSPVKKTAAPRKSAKTAFGAKKTDKKAPPASVQKKPVDRFRL